MSRRHSPRAVEEPDATPEAALESLLDKLCQRFGFCLSPDSRAALLANTPNGVHAFTNAVIAADGLDPATYDSDVRGQMVELVKDEAGLIL